MGYFTIKAKTNLEEMKVGERISESDFSILTQDNTFVQMEFHEEDEDNIEKYDVSPGVWTIQKVKGGKLGLEPTSFVKDDILSSFVQTKAVTDKMDCFFNKLDVYRKYGIEVPKRGVLLYGPAGTGKTTILSKVAQQYEQDKKTAIIIWPTDKFDAYDVKDFVKTFRYVNDTEKMILIVEDIGGVEIDQTRMRSDSSLLSLLDNQEKTFKIPILILATTNYPEAFLGNLTNRPQRFDDKIEVGQPSGEQRKELLKFFSKGEELSQDVLELIASKKTEEFTPAHIKESIIRAAIYDKQLKDTILEVCSEIEKYKKAFSKQKSMGMGSGGIYD